MHARIRSEYIIASGTVQCTMQVVMLPAGLDVLCSTATII
jgi:hypothetical protein